MFEGAKSRWPLLLPILKQDYAADQIVTGILENASYVIMPKIIYLVFLARAVLPTGIQDKIQELLGLTESYVILGILVN